MINWKVRIRNRQFWLSLIPCLLLLIAQICGMFGLEIDLSDIGARLLDIVTTVFLLLSILGIVTDPTTAGIGDSALAMTYEIPKLREEDAEG